MNSFASFWIYNPVAQHFYAAMHLSSHGKPETALTEAKKAVEADPSNAEARIALAVTLEDTGQSSEALAEAEYATELAPLNGAALLELGALLFKQKKLEGASKEARLAVAAAPQTTSVHSRLPTSLRYRGD